jgi:hypothetical protein
MDDEHGWEADDEWHPLFRMHLSAPDSWKQLDVMSYDQYWLRQATLGESAGLADDEAWRGRGLP